MSEHIIQIWYISSLNSNEQKKGKNNRKEATKNKESKIENKNKAQLSAEVY